MYELVNEVLESLKVENYKANFQENELDDDIIKECIEDETIMIALKEVIEAVGIRMKFVKKFKSLLSQKDSTACMTEVSETQSTSERKSGEELKVVIPPKLSLIEKDAIFKHPATPQSIQIIHVNQAARSNDNEPLIICLENALGSILSRTGGRPIAIIAIGGPPKTGKSELLNFVLRRLNGFKNDSLDWMGWMGDNDNNTPQEFILKETNEDTSSGIWMWSEPFTLQSKRHDTGLDVLLMETRGIFDDKSHAEIWTKLLGLSLLTCSCLIMNVVQEIDQKKFKIMEQFLSFGLSVYEDKIMVGKKILRIFQKLAFLIRDWEETQEYPYSAEGGDEFLEQNHSAYLNKLKKSFQEVSCFLLPSAGSNVLDSQIRSSIKSSVKFAETVEKVIENLVSPSSLSSLNFFGNSLTGQDLLEQFKRCVDSFNEEEKVNADTIDVITSQCCNTVVLNNCLSSFTSAMESKLAGDGSSFILHENLESYYTTAETEVMKIFQKAHKIGSKKVTDKLQDKLSSMIKSKYDELQKQNDDKLGSAVALALDQAVSEYLKITKKIDSEAFLDDEELQSKSDAAEAQALLLFDSILKITDSASTTLLEEKEKVRAAIQEKSTDFVNSYKLKKSEAEKEMEKTVHAYVEIYKAGVSKEINNSGKLTTDEELVAAHKTTSKKSIDAFTRKCSSSALFNLGQGNLISMITTEFQNFKDQIKRQREDVLEQCKTLIQTSVDKYREEMTSVTFIDEDEFQEAHARLKEDTIEEVRKSEKIPAMQMAQMLSDLEAKLQYAQLELLMKVKQNKMDIEKAIKEANKSAKKSYKEAMQSYINQTNNPIMEAKLQARHNKEKNVAIQSLKEFYEGMEGSLKNAKDLESAGLEELNASIQILYADYEMTNNQKWTNFEASAGALISDAKTSYVAKIKEIFKESFDKDDFKGKESKIREETEKLLVSKLNPEVAKPEFLKNLVDDLHKYIEAHFEESMEDFEAQIEEDEVAVKAALFEAKKYYNEEMNKRFNAKDWLESDELTQIHSELIETAITTAKAEVPLEPNQEKYLREAMKAVFLKYTEENARRYPVENPAIGIDLGTTYSCVGVFINGDVKIIPDHNQGEGTTVPSYVAFLENHTIAVGEPAKNQAFLDPLNTVFDAKRLIGRSFSDPVVKNDIKLWPFEVVNEDDKPRIKVRGKTFLPEQISAKVLVKMKQVAEKYLNKTVYQAVVTVPAYFNDGQRQATRDAAEIAGLKVMVLNEPTAAAMAYKLHRTDDLQRNVLIFDLGGGTFDVAVLEMKAGEIRVRATGGDTHLGGEDFDHNMVSCIIDRVKIKQRIDLGRDRESPDSFKKTKAGHRLRRLRDQCEKAKKMLSTSSSYNIVLDAIDENFNLEETFTREEFEQMNMHHFKKCITIVEGVLKDAGLAKTKVDDIVLVGGSTRIPKVQELLRAFFDGKKELNNRINADEAVARGAAIQAALLNGKQATSLKAGMKLFDVTPLSIGVEDVAGRISVVIPKNSPVPCSHTETFQTVVNNQTQVNFKIYEGESPMAADNNFLAKFLLKDIPTAPAGREPLDCTMTIDSEGILHCKAASRSGSASTNIKIEAYNGRMTQSEIEFAKTEDPFKW